MISINMCILWLVLCKLVKRLNWMICDSTEWYGNTFVFCDLSIFPFICKCCTIKESIVHCKSLLNIAKNSFPLKLLVSLYFTSSFSVIFNLNVSIKWPVGRFCVSCNSSCPIEILFSLFSMLLETNKEVYGSVLFLLFCWQQKEASKS